MVVELGDYFTLDCEAYSSSSVATKTLWQKDDGHLLEEGDRVRVFSDGTLFIGDAQLSDSGVYSCVATNRYGNSTASSHVTVLRKSVSADTLGS